MLNVIASKTNFNLQEWLEELDRQQVAAYKKQAQADRKNKKKKTYSAHEWSTLVNIK